MQSPLKKLYKLLTMFILLSLLSLSIASIFIYSVSEAVREHYTAGSLVTIDYAVSIAFYFTLFGMWLLFGILFIAIRFTVIDPISSLTLALRETTSSRDWSRRISNTAHIHELDSLVNDFNSMIIAVEHDHNQLKDISNRDALTGLFNRRGFDAALIAEIERSKRFALPFTIILVDMDNFKFINDTYGHPAGDYVLCSMVERLSASLRQVDLFARTGGDEFLIILPETSMEIGYGVAMKLHNLLIQSPMKISETGELFIPVTASIGVANFPQHGSNNTELLQAVDTVLYKAKQAGKNCVVRL